MQDKVLRISIMQFAPQWEEVSSSLHALEKCLAEKLAADNKSGGEDVCHLLLLPEMCVSGFSMHPELFAEKHGGEVSQTLSLLSKQYDLKVLAGVAQKDRGEQSAFYNRALYFNNKGEEKLAYSKQKLFAYAGEEKVYQPGKRSGIFQIKCGSKSVRAAVFICYDLRFPELFRKVAEEVQIIFVLANWPSSRQEHWHALLKARAIENQCFVIGVNRIGEVENGLHYSGGSVVFNANGDCVLDCQEALWSEFIIEADELVKQVEQQRSRFPFLRDRSDRSES